MDEGEGLMPKLKGVCAAEHGQDSQNSRTYCRNNSQNTEEKQPSS